MFWSSNNSHAWQKSWNTNTITNIQVILNTKRISFVYFSVVVLHLIELLQYMFGFLPGNIKYITRLEEIGGGEGLQEAEKLLLLLFYCKNSESYDLCT